MNPILVKVNDMVITAHGECYLVAAVHLDGRFTGRSHRRPSGVLIPIGLVVEVRRCSPKNNKSLEKKKSKKKRKKK